MASGSSHSQYICTGSRLAVRYGGKAVCRSVPCRFYHSTGCRFGDSCRYSHAAAGSEVYLAKVLSPLKGLQLFVWIPLWTFCAASADAYQPEVQEPCRFYKQGFCAAGDSCRFEHGPGEEYASRYDL